MLQKILFLLVSTITIASCEKFLYDNYTVFKILPKGDIDIKVLEDLRNSDVSYDFWAEPTPKAEYVTIMASPTQKISLKSFLEDHKLDYQVTINNVKDAIEKETQKRYTRNSRSMSWDAYYSLEDIESWMSDLATEYASVVTEVEGGVSYEGRSIKGLRISHGPGRRAILIESGIHSREWIAMSTACYMINELLTSDDAETQAAARDFDWYIFPVVNPDGYKYTEQVRLWRKNRRPQSGSAIGVDLNRNWNNNWLVTGASANPSSDIYAGPGPFSEPETRSLSSYLRSIDNLEMYISVHSFSQLLMVPFGNTTDQLSNYNDTVNIGRRAMGALSVRYGTQYVTGNIAEAIYEASGGSIDWVKEHLQTPLVFVYELRDRGNNGFLLPPEQILPNNQEVMDSLVDLVFQARRFGYFNSSSRVLSTSMLMSFFVAVVCLFR